MLSGFRKSCDNICYRRKKPSASCGFNPDGGIIADREIYCYHRNKKLLVQTERQPPELDMPLQESVELTASRVRIRSDNTFPHFPGCMRIPEISASNRRLRDL